MKIAEKFSTSSTWTQKMVTPIKALLQHPWVESIVRLSAINDTLGALHPLLSLSEVRARVAEVIEETPSTRTLVLQPNALWQGAIAGQFVRVRVEINGRQIERVYSLSSCPGQRRLAITVKRQEGGLVSNFLHDCVKLGDVLTISQAAGDFVLPQRLPEKILLLSAGSGITPVMAMLRDLQARQYQGDLVFLHVCRAQDDFIFGGELQTIAADFPALRLMSHFSQTASRFDVSTMQRMVPDLTQRETWMCGPLALMDAVQQHWSEQALTARLHSERFVVAPLRPVKSAGEPAAVAFAASGKSFVTRGSEPLLVQAERAGLTPKHGCRIGICRSCQCTKTSGTVQNLQTGDISSEPNELIRLCISAARSDLTLDL